MFGYSTKLIDTLMSTGWSTAFTSPVLEIRDGTRPESPDNAPVGNLLCSMTLPVTGYFAAASAGVINKSGTWSGAVGQSGTPTWFRIKNAADTGGSSTTLPRLDGDVGILGADPDLQLPSASVTAGDVVNVDAFYITWARSIMMLEGFMAN
jgi:hypothetical protein